MRGSLQVTWKPPNGITAGRRFMSTKLGLVNIARMMVLVTVLIPSTLVIAQREAPVNEVEAETPKIVTQAASANLAVDIKEVLEHPAQGAGKCSNDSNKGTESTGVCVEGLSNAEVPRILSDSSKEKHISSADEDSISKQLTAVIRERDELQRLNGELNTFIRYNMETSADLKRKVSELELTVQQLKYESVRRLNYDYGTKRGAYAAGKGGLLDGITLRDLGHVILVIHRAPLVILRHHCKLYSHLEDSLVRIWNVEVPRLGRNIIGFKNDVIVQGIEGLFTQVYNMLQSSFSWDTQLREVRTSLEKDLEEHMAGNYDVDSRLLHLEPTPHWSVKRLVGTLYWKQGHRHWLYWWYVVSKARLTAIKDRYTMPKLFFASYGNCIERLFNCIKIYLLWIACFVTSLFIDQGKNVEELYSTESSVREMFGQFVMSPFTARALYSASVDAYHIWSKDLDNRLELFYMYLTALYPDFSYVYPSNLSERLCLFFAMLVLVWVLIFCIKFFIVAVIRIVVISIFGRKRLRFTYNGFVGMDNWYNGSFLRWSINLLRQPPEAPKTTVPVRLRRKGKYLYNQNLSDDLSSGNGKKGAESISKPLSYWHGITRRNRGRDAMGMSDSIK